MQSATSIIEALGDTGEVASALSLSDSTVSSWKARGAIPAPHWGAIVRLAGVRERSEITLEALADLAANRDDAPTEARA